MRGGWCCLNHSVIARLITFKVHPGGGFALLVLLQSTMLGRVTSRWKQVIAYHFTGNSTDGSIVKPIVLEVIKKASQTCLHVILVTSDMRVLTELYGGVVGFFCNHWFNLRSRRHPVMALGRLHSDQYREAVFKSMINILKIIKIGDTKSNLHVSCTERYTGSVFLPSMSTSPMLVHCTSARVHRYLQNGGVFCLVTKECIYCACLRSERNMSISLYPGVVLIESLQSSLKVNLFESLELR